MKKVYTLLAAAVMGSGAFAQSQRLILAEEFTQASCGPCAQQNPAFNTLLQGNKGKVITLKYQTSWPGVDPMNKENPTEVQSRVDYYGLNSVPFSFMDGIQQTGASYSGSPSNWTQSGIDTRYGVTAPMSISVMHTLSGDLKSLHVECKIKTTAATLKGAMVAHVAVVEEEILFDNPPGTNGEKEFYGVMRKMLPNALGTALADSSVMGDSTVLSFDITVPAYIRDYNKIAVVAFVQDKTGKGVYQTGYSAPQPVQIDAALKSLSGLPVYQCTNTVTPQVEIKNSGATTLTSAKINYYADNNTPSVYDWTGSIVSDAVESVTLPAITVGTAGTHTINVAITDINGSADLNVNNNKKSALVGIFSSAIAPTFVEGFQPSAPSGNYVINNPDNDETWAVGTGAGGFATGTSQAGMKILLFYGATNSHDEIIFTKTNMSALGTNSAFVNFDYAHAPVTATTEKDKLEVMTSVDCGATWITAFTLSGKDVFTVAPTNTIYTPKANQWKKLNADISAVASAPEVMIKFVTTSGKGNNMWIDNISIDSKKATGIANVSTASASMLAYPNPASTATNLSVILTKTGVVNVEILNMLGEKVSTQSFSSLALGVNTITVDLSKLNNGMYIMNVVADGVPSHVTVSVEK